MRGELSSVLRIQALSYYRSSWRLASQLSVVPRSGPYRRRVRRAVIIMTLDRRVGFIGAGQMAEAMARGFIKGGVIKSASMVATDPLQSRRDVFKSFDVLTVTSNIEVVQKSDIVFIAVKPQYVSVVMKEVKPYLTDKHIIVSIAAGITLGTLKEQQGIIYGWFGGGWRDCAYLVQVCRHIFKVEEKQLTAVTGLSGSGPAYVFLVIEAMADGGRPRRPPPRHCPTIGSPDRLGLCQDGSGDWQAPWSPQGHGHLSRRDDNRGHARAGEVGGESGLHECRRCCNRAGRGSCRSISCLRKGGEGVLFRPPGRVQGSSFVLEPGAGPFRQFGTPNWEAGFFLGLQYIPQLSCRRRRRRSFIDIVGPSPLTVANLLHFLPGGAAARAAQDKQTRYAVLLSRQQPPVAFPAFAFETFGGLHADALALLQRLQGLLNQAIIAQEDVEGYFVIRRVSFIIAAAVGRQLAARRV
eukprot:jgi/Botrbrau1/14314/Bobra.0287s0007.1